MPLKKSTDIFDYVGHLRKSYGKYRKYTNGECAAIEAITVNPKFKWTHEKTL